MKFIVAVSGGVDSVVLLDMLVDAYGADSLVVAHFDHGIRLHSDDDAYFVETLALRYGCLFESRREELGADASEAHARDRRYLFLDELARRHAATLVTAHHLDDLVETIALQLLRGTGWRGLTPFGRAAKRPLLTMTKRDIYEYAREHGLDWCEDETNQDMRYARNRVRPAVQKLPLALKRQVHDLYVRQWVVRSEIESVVRMYGDGEHRRYFFIMLSDELRYEFLRHSTNGLLTRPQLQRLAHAICVAQPKTTYQAGSGVNITFTTRTFTVELIK